VIEYHSSPENSKNRIKALVVLT